MWGGAWEARDDSWAQEADWAGVRTLPREVSLTADGAVVQRPARELLALRCARVLHRTGHITRPDPAELGRVSRTFALTAAPIPDPTGTSGPAARRLDAERDHALTDTAPLLINGCEPGSGPVHERHAEWTAGLDIRHPPPLPASRADERAYPIRNRIG